MYKLQNTIMNYAWGAREAIASIQRRQPAQEPEAELWMGSHPKAPSIVELDGVRVPLDRALVEDPARWFNSGEPAPAGLPFLLKILAASTPLSLQAHPSKLQAENGFAREQQAGIPLDAFSRNYKDSNHKPELLAALTPFEALCGFRPIPDILDLFDLLSVPELDGVLQPLRDAPYRQPASTLPTGNLQEFLNTVPVPREHPELRVAFERLMTASPAEQARRVDAVVKAIEGLGSGLFRFERSAKWALRLAKLYPVDIGVVLSLFMNVLVLQPGEAIYLPAGNLHAYLGGTGIELMANSDNVLRGGLTPKHVDVPELLSILSFSASEIAKVHPVQREGIDVYPTPASEFELSRFSVERTRGAELPPSAGPEIVVAIEGTLELKLGDRALKLEQGQSAVLPFRTQSIQVTGKGLGFRAAVPKG